MSPPRITTITVLTRVGQRLIGESGGQTYRLGDRVEVRVEAVNMDERKIDFSLISSERAPRNVGKTAREKAKRAPLANRVAVAAVGKQVNFEPDSAFRKRKDQQAKPKGEKKAKTVGENTENRRRDQSQARGKEENRRVIDVPSLPEVRWRRTG